MGATWPRLPPSSQANRIRAPVLRLTGARPSQLAEPVRQAVEALERRVAAVLRAGRALEAEAAAAAVPVVRGSEPELGEGREEIRAAVVVVVVAAAVVAEVAAHAGPATCDFRRGHH